MKPSYEELERKNKELNNELLRYKNIKDREELFQKIIETTSEGFWLVDEKGAFKEVNNAYCEMIGYTRQELLQMSISDVEAVETKSMTDERIQKVKHIFGDRFETIHRSKSGNLIPVEINTTYFPFYDSLFIVFIHDISNRKNIEKHLAEKTSEIEAQNEELRQANEELSIAKARIKESEKKYKNVVETTTDLITVMDRAGRFVFVNHASKKFFGLSPKECIGKYAFDFIHPDDKDFTQTNFSKWIKSKNNVFDFENRQINKNGEVLHVSWNIHLEREDEQVLKITSIARNITENKKIEKALKESEAFLNETGEIAKIGGWKIDLNSNKLYWTKQVYKMHEVEDGYVPTVEKAINFYDKDSLETIQKAVSDAIYSKKAFDVELGINTAKGKHLFVRAKGRIFKDENDENEFVGGTFQDITKEKYAQKILEKSEYLLRIKNKEYQEINEELKSASEKAEENSRMKDMLLNKFNEAQKIAHIGSWDWNMITNEVWWSEETYRIFGVRPEEFTPDFNNNANFIHPDDVANYFKVFQECIENVKPLNFDVRIKSNDGKITYCNTQGRVIYENNKPVHFIGTLMDISDRKKAEQEMKDSKRLLLKIAENFPNSYISIIENNFTIGFTSGQEFTKQKLNPNEYIGLSLEKVFGKHSDFVLEMYEQTFTGKETVFELYINNQYQLYKTVPIYEEDGSIQRILSVVENITEKKLEDIQLQNTASALAKLNEDKDRFISILAHDLKNPFSSLLGFTDLLATNCRIYPIEKVEYFATLLNEISQKIYNLLEDLLMWTRSQAGKLPFNKTQFYFQEICCEALGGLYQMAKAKDISINYSSNEVITADVNMFKTILRNLVSNAIKFTEKGGAIIIYTERKQTEIEVCVEDSGIGISEESKLRLFDISQMQSTEGTDNEKGTGLGLFLCKDFVEKHGGKIWVESEKEKGSIFKFTMPIIM